MADGKPRRRYDSSRRREQAEVTRRQILAAAQKLFAQRGYAATTMSAIGGEAGVALKTVYLAAESKSGIVRALWDVALRGERDIAVAAQPWYREVLDEPDPVRKLRLNARNSRAVKVRIGGVLQIIRSGALIDPELDALWQHIQTDFYANQQVIVQQLADAAQLRSRLDVSRGTDILWTLNHPDVWNLLVQFRHWTPETWETWFADACCQQLLAGDQPG